MSGKEHIEKDLPQGHTDSQAALEVVAALLVAYPQEASAALQAASNRGPEWRKAFVEAVARAARAGVPRAWHEVVKVEAFAAAVAAIVAANPLLTTMADENGVTALDVAMGGCRQAMIKACFLGRYQIDRAVHISATCTVLLGRDLQLPFGGPAATVALKLLRDEEDFLSEVLPRVQYNLNKHVILGVLRVHIAPSETDSSGGSAAKELLQKCEGVEGDVHGSFGAAHAPYHLCIVMPCGDCTLQDAMLHDFEGVDWNLVKSVGKGVLRALRHMHVQGLVHGDVTLLIAQRCGLRELTLHLLQLAPCQL
ncbi:hypothetical protein FOA52_006557 [Chlamydomonas sp. UWO 241]|nr:hypothetical protein FOA52_006557 [Chlamydomonas sp. UWO 241]